jgi:hypothetical protein
LSNLQDFNNLFADLASSAYFHRPNSYPSYSFGKNTSKPYDYSKSARSDDASHELTLGGTNLPHDGIVNLQRDPSLHTVEVTGTHQTPQENGGFASTTYLIQKYKKGRLTDERAGFNAYFLTDTETLNDKTQNAYIAVRGSDAIGIENANDWVSNDGAFAVGNAYIPQAKLAYTGMKQTLKDMQQKAPNAKLNVTGHSLGTMVSAQAVAKLYQEDPKSFAQIGKVVLFDGPDVTTSLKKMGLSDQEIKAVGKKVTYYVNPLDVVSMLNRTQDIKDQFGTVHYIVPLNFTDTLNKKNSAHDFGEFQMNAQGQPLEASSTFHPEMITAGKQLAKLIDNTINKLKDLLTGKGLSRVLQLLLAGVGVEKLAALGLGGGEIGKICGEFIKGYAKIVAQARDAALKWDQQHIDSLQGQIKQATGAKKVTLRQELLVTVAQLAVTASEKHAEKLNQELDAAHEKIELTLKNAHSAVQTLGSVLPAAELNARLSDFTLAHIWNDGTEALDKQQAKTYQTELEQFGASLIQIGNHIEQTDSQGAAGFKQQMAETVKDWS